VKESQGTVFIVDDDAAVCRALQRLLESVGLDVTTFGSARDFLEEFDAGRPGCLVLDVRMPGLSGLDLQDALNSKNVTIPIIFISAHGDVPVSVRAMKAGAMDFFQKPIHHQTFLDAVNRALAKDAEVRKRESEKDDIRRRIESLTPREREVLNLLVAGLRNKQIAGELGASERTIKIHRARVMEKMEAESLPDLVLMAQAVGISKRS
jgi:RNA polymerase sigma factor (sigma-70 family)